VQGETRACYDIKLRNRIRTSNNNNNNINNISGHHHDSGHHGHQCFGGGAGTTHFIEVKSTRFGDKVGAGK
jgi:hypothetical protein